MDGISPTLFREWLALFRQTALPIIGAELTGAWILRAVLLAHEQPSAREQLQHIHSPLLEEHHDRIQSLLDKNPTASRQQLGPQIHAISNETHRKIHVLLTDHQKELEKAMQQREHNGREDSTTGGSVGKAVIFSGPLDYLESSRTMPRADEAGIRATWF